MSELDRVVVTVVHTVADCRIAVATGLRHWETADTAEAAVGPIFAERTNLRDMEGLVVWERPSKVALLHD